MAKFQKKFFIFIIIFVSLWLLSIILVDPFLKLENSIYKFLILIFSQYLFQIFLISTETIVITMFCLAIKYSCHIQKISFLKQKVVTNIFIVMCALSITSYYFSLEVLNMPSLFLLNQTWLSNNILYIINTSFIVFTLCLMFTFILIVKKSHNTIEYQLYLLTKVHILPDKVSLINFYQKFNWIIIMNKIKNMIQQVKKFFLNIIKKDNPLNQKEIMQLLPCIEFH